MAGSLAERWGTKRALARCMFGWAGMLWMGAAVQARAGFAVCLVGVFALGGAVDVVMNIAATAALAHQPGRLVRFHSLFNAGAVVGAIVVGIILRAGLSWRWVWIGISVLALLLSMRIRVVRLPASESGEHFGLFEALGTVWREGLMLLAIVFAVSALVEGGVDTWGVVFLREELHSGLLVGAAAFVIGQSVATLARVTLGPAAGSLGARRGVGLGAGIACGGLVLMALTGHAGLAAFGLVEAAAGMSVCWPLLMAHAGSHLDRPALVVGGVTSIGYLGFVLGPVLVGTLADSAGLASGLLALAACAAFVATATPSRMPASRSARSTHR